VTHRFVLQVETSACHQDVNTRPVIYAQKLRVFSEKEKHFPESVQAFAQNTKKGITQKIGRNFRMK